MRPLQLHRRRLCEASHGGWWGLVLCCLVALMAMAYGWRGWEGGRCLATNRNIELTAFISCRWRDLLTVFILQFSPFCLLVLLFSIPVNHVYFMFKCFFFLDYVCFYWILHFILILFGGFCKDLFLLQIYVLLQLNLWTREEHTY